jgi:acetyltransferase-like isoleucine patch superfamily enzyme
VPYRRFFATSDHPVAKLARATKRRVEQVSVPMPKALKAPVWIAHRTIRTLYEESFRVLVSEPLLKANCAAYGERLRSGSFIHYITGVGDLVLGDDVTMDGCVDIHFAARFVDRPTLTIGDRTGIGHTCMLTIGKSITIGNDCRIASGVWIFDSNGHPADPEARRRGETIPAEEVKPVVIEDNVWIGRSSVIHPGVRIGRDSIVSAGSVVMSDVPPRTIVAGNPARKIAVVGGQPAKPAGHAAVGTPEVHA